MAYLNSDLVKEENDTVYFAFQGSKGKLGDLLESQVNELKDRLYNLMIEENKTGCNNSGSGLFGVIHKAVRMLFL